MENHKKYPPFSNKHSFHESQKTEIGHGFHSNLICCSPFIRCPCECANVHKLVLDLRVYPMPKFAKSQRLYRNEPRMDRFLVWWQIISA